MDEHASNTTDGLHQLEGYLTWQAEVSTAHRDAVAFADRLPWLTTGQREEIMRTYTQERLHVSRRSLTHIAQRCREVRREYEERYRRLKTRMVSLILAVLAVQAAAFALLTHPPANW